jgi:uncharacterized protein
MRVVSFLLADGTRLCQAEVANNPWTRMRGLLGRKNLAPDGGLLIDPCSSVHMLFMRFPIDVVYLNKADEVVKIAEDLKPWRLSFGGKGAKRVIELPAGRATQTGLVPGVRLDRGPATKMDE